MSALPRRLGRVLLELGFITQSQLDTALILQPAFGRRLGEVLLELGACDQQQLERALATQHPQRQFLIDLDATPLEPRIRSTLPASFARHASMIPVRFSSGVLVIASCGPVDPVLLREACVLAGVRSVEVRLCTAGALSRALEHLYGSL